MKVTLRLGDCLPILQGMEPASVDAVVCDPPYNLTAVSRGGSSRKPDTGPYGRHRLSTQGRGFMGQLWDGTGIAFNPELWAAVHRVLRPGGLVKAFSGTRTFHRMVPAMQEGGFIIIGFEAWAYGSGFPKSLNISKAIQRMEGPDRAKAWTGWGTALKPAWEPIIIGRKPQ